MYPISLENSNLCAISSSGEVMGGGGSGEMNIDSIALTVTAVVFCATKHTNPRAKSSSSK